MKYNTAQGKYEIVGNSGTRFLRSFLIAFIYTFFYVGSLVLDADMSKAGAFYESLFILFLMILIFASIVGIITGALYFVGYVLSQSIEKLPKRRLGQIGVIFTILGIIIAALPSLIT